MKKGTESKITGFPPVFECFFLSKIMKVPPARELHDDFAVKYERKYLLGYKPADWY